MYSPHVHPAVDKRGELGNDCLYLHHPARRIDLQFPMALTQLSPNNSPELIDNLYLTRVHSSYSAMTSAFMVYIFIPNSTTVDIINILSAQLDEMHKDGAQTS
jgi:hypothetical protein